MCNNSIAHQFPVAHTARFKSCVVSLVILFSTDLEFRAELLVGAGRGELGAAGEGEELEGEGELALDVGRGSELVGGAPRVGVLAPPRHEHGSTLVREPCPDIILKEKCSNNIIMTHLFMLIRL